MITSFTSTLNMYARLWKPGVITVAQHLQTCGPSLGATTLKISATVKVPAYIFFPR